MRSMRICRALAVEIQHTDVGADAGILRPLDVAHEAERGNTTRADAERNGPGMRLRKVPFQQVGHDLELAGGEDLLRNLAAGLEVGRLERDMARVTGHAHLAAYPARRPA